MAEDQAIEEILDTIGDPRARKVLAEISRKPRSAKDLADALNMSRATVYRRLDVLESHDLISDTTLVSADGNHYKVFECNFNSTLISLEGDEYEVRIFREDQLPNRFSALWDEIADGARK